MAIHSRGRLELAKQWKERDQISPERTKVWTEPKSKKKVPVVYYLSRNGHLEHPHFMEVSLSSPLGLCLKDVINRLNVLRGRGMVSLYSWSAKRSYKNGFVWQDLCGDDFIYPAHHQEYVLKGSEILALSSSSPSSQDSASSSSIPGSLEISKSSDSELRRKNKIPWSSVDLSGEYKVYKSELIADASTQTEDKKQRRRSRTEIPNPESRNPNPSSGAVLDRDEIEISPPPSSSSPETLESLINADGRLVSVGKDDQDRTVGSYSSSGRFRASEVLMQLVSCGSISVKGSSRVPPRGGLDSGMKEMDGMIGESSFGAVTFDDKEYFSGSLIEMKKKAGGIAAAPIPVLQRSNSYNAADRSSKMEEADDPRKSKAATAAGRREETASICRSAQGSSKRVNHESSNWTQQIKLKK